VRGWRLRSKNRFQSVFEAPELLFFRFYREKIEKKIFEGVAVAGSSTARSATDVLVLKISALYSVPFGQDSLHKNEFLMKAEVLGDFSAKK
jgi:hypothetical protein